MQSTAREIAFMALIAIVVLLTLYFVSVGVLDGHSADLAIMKTRH